MTRGLHRKVPASTLVRRKQSRGKTRPRTTGRLPWRRIVHTGNPSPLATTGYYQWGPWQPVLSLWWASLCGIAWQRAGTKCRVKNRKQPFNCTQNGNRSRDSHVVCSKKVCVICNLSHDTQQTQDVHPMLVKCWATICDADTTLFQHLVMVSCLLGNQLFCFSLQFDIYKSVLITSVKSETSNQSVLNSSLIFMWQAIAQYKWHCELRITVGFRDWQYFFSAQWYK